MQTSSTTPVKFSQLGLHERLLKATDELGFEQAMPVQAQTFEAACNKKDLLVSAKTGSGKTAAFLLPIMQQLLQAQSPETGTRSLILAPTRELAHQIFKQCKKLSRFTRLQCGLITGGEAFKYQRALFRKNPEIIIATPGRLLEHIQHDNTDLSGLEILVLDEADRMLDMGFSEEVLTIIAQCNSQRQTLLFSATLTGSGIKTIVDSALNDPEKIILEQARDKHSNIHQQVVLADDKEHKQALLLKLLQTEPYNKALIFSNTKIQTNLLQGPLRGQGLRVSILHGDMDQDSRKQVMDFYRTGKINILIATDVAARGLDVDDIDLIINFDMARNPNDYVHRIGRTGRADKDGIAISLVNTHEWNQMTRIENFLKLRFERKVVKDLVARFKGPKKLKSSGKAAGNKKKTVADKAKEPKVKQRHRDKKNIGKRRKPSQPSTDTVVINNGGWKPLKRKSSDES